jgi:alpha-glucosidase (family GH31 glycosyl hydrolase)
MRNTDALGYDAETANPLYKHMPVYTTLVEGRAFALFYDTAFDCEFDMGCEIDNYFGPFRSFKAAGSPALTCVRTLSHAHTRRVRAHSQAPRWSSTSFSGRAWPK